MSDHKHPRTKRELLAQTIADALGDQQRTNLYLQYCQKYPQKLLLRAYGEAKATPLHRVRKARAAIFFYLIKRYDDERKNSPCR